MNSACWEGVSHKACLAGNGCPLAKRHNAVDDPFPARPEGVPQMHPSASPKVPTVGTALAKGIAITCGRCLAWIHLGSSEFINIALLGYWPLAHAVSDGTFLWLESAQR